MAIPLTGRFPDTVGLAYRCGSLEGHTSPDGGFQYFPGEDVVFSIGPLELGATKGKPVVTVVDLVDNPSLTNPKLINIARLLFTFAPGLGFEKPIWIGERERNIVSQYAAQINVNTSEHTALDSVIQDISTKLSLPVKTLAHVRNHLRRSLAGFRVQRDVRIPMRDGEYLLGDIYLPYEGSKHPALMSSTPYGKRIVYGGPDLDDPDEIAKWEESEEKFFTTPDNTPLDIPRTAGTFGNWAKQRAYETISTFNTFFWVPRGYIMVKLDPRGIGQTPGKRRLLVVDEEHEDYCDAVEWIAKQPWCTGNVGLNGNSYGGIWQWQVALRKPHGLKAFFPFGFETDFYRDLSHVGGIPTYKFFEIWLSGIHGASPKWTDEVDLLKTFPQHPFDDDYWEHHNVPLERIDLPVFFGAAQMFFFHHRAPYEAWRKVASPDKAMEIVDSNYYPWPNLESRTANKLFLFAEKHLKGVEPSEKLEPVGMQMRVGYGDWYWRKETDWEVPGTKYIDWHLHPDGTLSKESPSGNSNAKALSYPADIEPKSEKAGLTFLSERLEADVELAGHFTATLNLSSTSNDADVVVSIWAIDENDKLVRFCIGPNLEPFATGVHRASHRKTDPSKSLPGRPWHTHKKEDYAPLKDGEVVEVNVEICPSTARLRAGWRLRVDILPSEVHPDAPTFHMTRPRSWIREYHDGAENALHLGGGFQNFVRLPTVPLKEVGPINVVT